MVNSLRMLEECITLQEIQQAQMLEMLQKMHKQQQQYWAYAEQRDIAMKKSLQKNFTKLVFPFPEFPEEVLEPVASKESDSINPEEEEWKGRWLAYPTQGVSTFFVMFV